MRYIYLITILFTILSCNNSQPATNIPVDNFKLSEGNMYQEDSVVRYLSGTIRDKKKADKLFLEAIEIFRNKKDAKGSIPIFRRSILMQPQAKTYYELGNALLDVKGQGLREAIKAYNMAEVLDYQPLSKLLYNTACTYSLLDEQDSGMHYLVSAIEFGYSNMQQIYKDNDLAFLREDSWMFTWQIDKALSGASDPDKLLWTLFSYEFKPVEFPLVLDANYAKKIETADIAYDFERFIPEMRDAKFSRDVGSEYYYAGKVREGNGYKTLVYAVRDVMIDEFAPPYYYLVSFDGTGKMIDKRMIAGHKELDQPFKVCTIQENGDVEIRSFLIKYAKDPEDGGYQNNEMVEKTEVGVEYYAIAEDGKIVPGSAPLAMNR